MILESAIALCVGLVAGAASWMLFWPVWDRWRDLPRETGTERRRHRWRHALHEAEDRLAEGHRHLAMRWARRAHRLMPDDPWSSVTLARALVAARRYDLGLRHFEAAYDLCDGLCPEDHVAVFAVDAARCCARLRIEASTPLEAEARAEQVLTWARIAVEDDAFAVDVLGRDPLLRDLCGQVRLLHGQVREAHA